MTDYKLDSTDLKILSILQKEGRISNTRLAKKVELSESACFNRMKRLEESRAIIGYRAIINRRLFSPSITMSVEIKLESQKISEMSRFNDLLRSTPEVTAAYAVNGETDYLILVVAKDVEHYINIMNDLTKAHNGIKSYESRLLVRTIKDAPLNASSYVKRS